MNDSNTPGQAWVGLCGRCVHAQIIRSDRGSRFYLCRQAASNPAFPKYPVLPMLACSGFEPTIEPPDRTT